VSEIVRNCVEAGKAEGTESGVDELSMHASLWGLCRLG
jgi:hypothetical protein